MRANLWEEFKRSRPNLILWKSCLTIASACQPLLAEGSHLIPKSVAVQPFNGWKGAQTLDSLSIARQWLDFQEPFDLRGEDALCRSGYVIRHAFNGGEK